MRVVSTEKQRIIMFIPVINWINWIIWLNNSYYLRFPPATNIKGFIIGVFCLLPAWFVAQELTVIFPNCETFIFLICEYIASIAMGFGLIRLQREYNI